MHWSEHRMMLQSQRLSNYLNCLAWRIWNIVVEFLKCLGLHPSIRKSWREGSCWERNCLDLGLLEICLRKALNELDSNLAFPWRIFLPLTGETLHLESFKLVMARQDFCAMCVCGGRGEGGVMLHGRDKVCLRTFSKKEVPFCANYKYMKPTLVKLIVEKHAQFMFAWLSSTYVFHQVGSNDASVSHLLNVHRLSPFFTQGARYHYVSCQWRVVRLRPGSPTCSTRPTLQERVTIKEKRRMSDNAPLYACVMHPLS
jgi:hypothetical protein